MNWSTSVLTGVSSDTEPTIIVTFDSAKYIFNAGENTNRAFLQSRQNWKKTRSIFFTSLGTQRASGLAGLLMSFADATIPSLDVVGPQGTMHFLAAMRTYAFRETMPITTYEASSAPMNSSSPPDPLYKDENISVYAIPILPSDQITFPISDSEAGPTDEGLESPSLKRKRDLSPDSSSKRLMSADDAPAGSSRPLEIKSFRDLISERDFSPESLTGEQAQQWRSLIVDTMFPGPKRPRPDEQQRQRPLDRDSKKKTKNKGGGRKNTVDKRTRKDEGSSKVDSVAEELNTNDTHSSILISEPEQPAQSINENRVPRKPYGFHKRLPRFSSTGLGAEGGNPENKSTLAYVIVGPRIRGKFDVNKAEALGVPRGRIRGRLTQGESVTFAVKVGDETVERTVRPDECVGESVSPGVIIILDIPTPAHIRSLISSFHTSPFFAKFRSDRPEDTKEYAVRTVFHICGDGVLEDPQYSTFMNGFGTNVHHIVASREHVPDPITFTSAAFNHLRLNQLDTQMFPLPKYQLIPDKDISKVANLPPNTTTMASNTLINMHPPRPPVLNVSTDDLFHPIVTSSTQAPLPASTSQCFAEAQANVQEYLNSGGVVKPLGCDVNIIPLGTGSSLPTKYRNVSATLIQIPHWGNILLDAGEGTWGQLVRQFGLDSTSPSNVWKFLRDLKCIFVSHVHGDHHMGLAKILAKRRQLNPPPTEPLYLVTLRSVHLYLREWSDIEDLGLEDPSGNGVITVMSEALHYKQRSSYNTAGLWRVDGNEPWTDMQQSQQNARKMCSALGLLNFITIDVYHRTRCYGAFIEHADGWSIVFSGDTMPTHSLVYVGQDATLLIHEATMDDDKADLAKLKGHSTFGQAVEVGRNMNAQNILLTHFSARYPKMPPAGLDRPAAADGSKKEPIIALAFDHANITIGNMWKLNFYLPAIQQSFHDTTEEGDEDANTSEVIDVEVDVS